MRVYNPAFADKNKSHDQDPIFVVRISFDDANLDTHYFTDKVVDGLTGSVHFRSLKMVSQSSQKLDPGNAHALIGNAKFEVLDMGLTDLMRAKLDADLGLNGKRVEMYKGHVGLLWSQFELTDTYTVRGDIAHKHRGYVFNCSDAQRNMKKKLFVVKETKATASFSETDSIINVLTTSAFEKVYQVPSAAGKTLLRGRQTEKFPTGHAQAGALRYPDLAAIDEIGIIKIQNPDGDGFELAMWTSSNSVQFTGLHRGVLGTNPVAVEIAVGTEPDSLPTIEEYVYINMPAVKAIYGLLTGSIYGHAGKYFPEHWHLAISTDYISTAAFVNVGIDVWDVDDDDAGFGTYISGAVDVEGKKFIEKDMLYIAGLYMPVNNHGELGMKRMGYIGPNASAVRTLNKDNIISYEALVFDQASILNRFLIRWNWDEKREIYTRHSPFIDPVSIARHKESDVKVIESKTLHNSRHSSALIKYHFDTLRSRYAGYPLRMNCTLTHDQDDLEIGDIVWFDNDELEDFSNDGGHHARAYEIQHVRIDKRNGRVSLSLFGSSQRASDIVPEDTENPNLAFVTSEGTEITAAEFGAGNVTEGTGVKTITNDITLTGHDDINHPDAIYFCTEDLTIHSSATIHTTKNVQIRVLGFYEQNGHINGRGQGLDGGVGDDVFIRTYVPVTANLGKAGIGHTMAQAGMKQRFYDFQGNRWFYEALNSKYGGRVATHGNRVVHGLVDQVYLPNLRIDVNGQLRGMPVSLMGTSGSSGGNIVKYPGTSNKWNGSGTSLKRGGNGGKGGGGLAVFSIGAVLNAGATIDLSGGDGSPGAIQNEYGKNIATAGAGGGGAPGGLYMVNMNSSQTIPTLNSNRIKMLHGLCPMTTMWSSVSIYESGSHTREGSGSGNPPGNPYSSNEAGGGSQTTAVNAWSSNAQNVFLDTLSSTGNTVPDYVSHLPLASLTEVTNMPVTPSGDTSTIEVSVTRPIFPLGEVDNYSYSNVYIREEGVGDQYVLAGKASPELLIEKPSDGRTYRVWVVAVSTNGLEAGSGPAPLITMSDTLGRSDVEMAAVYPFSGITGMKIPNQVSSVFAGLDASCEWNGVNSTLAYFDHYQIEVWSGAQLLRIEKSVSPFYTYSFAKNVSDYFENEGARVTNQAGVYLAIAFKVKPVSKYFNEDTILYSGTLATYTTTASSIESPDNLRFHQTSRDDLDEVIANAVSGGATAQQIQDIQDAYDQGATTAQIQAIADAAITANWSGMNNDNGNMPADNADVTDYNDSRIANNLIDLTPWEEGQTGDVAGFTALDPSNQRDLKLGPYGIEEIVWEVNGTGGFVTDLLYIDSTKPYRLSAWVKADHVDGTGFISMAAVGINKLIRLDNSTLMPVEAQFFSNPFVGNREKWLLFVGYIMPHSTTSTVNTYKGGVYNPEDGVRLAWGADFKWASNTINSVALRVGNSGGPVNRHMYIARPRMDVVNGGEPTVSSLLLGDHLGDLLNTQQQYDDILGNKPPSNADATDYDDNRIVNAALDAVIAEAAEAGATVAQIADIQDAYDKGATTAQIQAIADAANTANWSQMVDDDGNMPAQNADVTNYDADKVRGNKTENGLTVIPSPVGGAFYQSGSAVGGAIIITLPNGYANAMVQMEIDVWLYDSAGQFTLTVGGYLSSSQNNWYKCLARIIGDSTADNRVRLGKNASGKAVIVIGEEGSSSWSYPTVKVKNFQASYTANSIGAWDDGWSVAISSSLSGIVFGPTAPGLGQTDFSDNLLDSRQSNDTFNVDGIDAVVVRSAAALVYRNSAETSEFIDWSTGANATMALNTDKHSGSWAVLCTKISSGTGVIKVNIPEAIIMSFAGRKVRLSLFAKQPNGDVSNHFFSGGIEGPNMSGGGLGNTWYTTDYRTWAIARRDMTIPVVPTAGTWNVLIDPDRASSGKAMLIDSILIEPVTESSDIDYSLLDEAPMMVKMSGSNGQMTGYASNSGPHGTYGYRQSVGKYRIYHTSGTSGDPIIISPHGNTVARQYVAHSSGYIAINLYNDDYALVDSDFSVILDSGYKA